MPPRLFLSYARAGRLSQVLISVNSESHRKENLYKRFKRPWKVLPSQLYQRFTVLPLAAVSKQLFAAMGIERDDKERRQDWVMRGFRQFDAPVSIVVCFDKSLDDNGTIAHFDLGAVTYGLVLAAWSKGLGCVINGQGIMQSPVVREHAQIPDDQVIMTCVAMGWPDKDFSANAVVSTRRPVEEVTRFVGFDD